MINVEDSILINCPIEEAFAFVADQTKAPQWQEGLLEVQRTTNGPLGVGTKHTAVRKFLGRRMELANEYTQYDPNKQITFVGDGTTRFEVSYLTEATANGTKITCRMQMEPGGLMGLAEPLIARGLKKDFAANFLKLKALLENQAEQVSP